MSNTCQTATEPLRRSEIERLQRVVDVARVQAWTGGRDGVRFAPERLAAQEPRALVLGQRVSFRLTAAHRPMVPQTHSNRRLHASTVQPDKR